MSEKRGKSPGSRATQFKDGGVGNPNGRKGYQRSLREYAMDLIHKPKTEWKAVVDDENAPGGMRHMAEMLVNAKTQGTSIIDIIEQLEGKAPQSFMLQADININDRKINVHK